MTDQPKNDKPKSEDSKQCQILDEKIDLILEKIKQRKQKKSA
jgi:hypothetical protein